MTWVDILLLALVGWIVLAAASATAFCLMVSRWRKTRSDALDRELRDLLEEAS